MTDHVDDTKQSRAAHRIGTYRDACVIYPYEHDGASMFVAHSLLSNNIGIGPTRFDAYCQLLFALISIFKYTPLEQLENVLDNPAPREVRGRYRRSSRISEELQERAIQHVKEMWKQRGLKEIDREALLLELGEVPEPVELMEKTGTEFVASALYFDADDVLDYLADAG